MTEIRRIGPDDWQQLRDVRLAALQEAPDAYESTYDNERRLTEDDWRARIGRAAQFVAVTDGTPVGIAVGLFDPEDCAPHERLLVSIWVAPTHRGAGISARLMDAVAEWARADGASALLLDVGTHNQPAWRAYERYGFRPTGRRHPMPRDPSILEETMTLTL